MDQYFAIKAEYPEALLLFRVGDFYETFAEDAVKTSKALGIVLTRRANGAASSVELAGFPHHALDTYLPKLVRAGYKVAVCDQLEDPKMTKKIVKRGITEVVTPGLSTTRNCWRLHSTISWQVFFAATTVRPSRSAWLSPIYPPGQSR
jgi:DNA mismatch repair protein MutS